jgi:hypothetical protein
VLLEKLLGKDVAQGMRNRLDDLRKLSGQPATNVEDRKEHALS